MGLQDRDYIRERRKALWSSPKTNWHRRLMIGAAIFTVLSAAFWFARDVQNFAGSGRPAEGSLIVNINSATQEQLESVPRIGPTLAVQIIAGRPYESVEDLVRIAGIGQASLDGMRPFITVEEETRKR
jgi:DNA uptake protein ComE-like DNA-binding protein